MEAIIIPIFWIVSYLLPTIIGAARGKQNLLAIAALNILLGWSFIGWVVALVWALTKDAQQPSAAGQKPSMISVSESEARLSRARVWIAVVVVISALGFWMSQVEHIPEDSSPPASSIDNQ
ncbi:superinfection immunity protein [Cobetia sp. MC34]|uniref:superinfection immunity protein n=1 Tax=Cobetia sp. MC34 TaxID=2785080 RepID=UPI001BC97E0C|nr:superinfection immunity protein [Cobetia sp. MC34]MBS4155243.1 superinfection immunity protein [Cobetia sp. MC34]